MNNHLVMVGTLFRIWEGKFSILKCEHCGEKVNYFGNWRFVDVGKAVHKKCYDNYIKEHPEISEEKEIKTDTEKHYGLVWFGFIIIILAVVFGFIGGVICILGGVILGIVLIAVGLNTQSRKEEMKVLADAINKSSTSKENPFDVLKMRYAKGEITKEEFEQMKKDIS